MAYNKTTWENAPSTNTPINANNLNKIEEGIYQNSISIETIIPAGIVSAYGGGQAPEGWLICDGSAVSRTTYSKLFSAIGINYGGGDGTTTFNLPDLKGKVIVGIDSQDEDFDTAGKTGGEKTHTLTVDEIPSHNHNEHPETWMNRNGSRFILTDTSGSWINTVSVGGRSRNWPTDSTGGGQAHNIVQPYTVVNYIIKY